MAKQLAKNKEVFLGLTALSVTSLVGAFGYPYQQLEVYKQTFLGGFNIPYEKTFIITDSDNASPYGFIRDEAVKVAQVYQDYSIQKWVFLLVSLSSAATAWAIGSQTVPNAEIDEQVNEIKLEGKKELLLEQTKHSLAIASKAQRMQFVDEMRALMDEFGSSVEAETLDADEAAEDKFVQASYLEMEGYPLDVVVSQVWGFEKDTDENKNMQSKYLAWKRDDDEETPVTVPADKVDFRGLFPEQMDNTVWKAILSAQQSGASKESILKDVLNCSSDTMKQGEAYIDFLKGKFGL